MSELMLSAVKHSLLNEISVYFFLKLAFTTTFLIQNFFSREKGAIRVR